jgi:hypothetical protein
MLGQPPSSAPALSGGRGAAIVFLKANAALSGMGFAGSRGTAQDGHLSPRSVRSLAHEASDILPCELDPQGRPK